MQNTVKTALLLGVLSALLLFLGESLGGAQGLVVGFFFAVVTNFASYWFSDKIVLSMYRAKEVGPEAHGCTTSSARLAQRARLPMPRCYVIPDASPNAFATGRNPSHAAVAATEGILRILNDDELEGVLAHELAHVKHRDILISSVAATLAAAIMMVARFAMFFGGGRSDDREGQNPIALLATIILAPIAAMLIQAAISRSREFDADAGGAAIAGRPLGLVSALQKIEGGSRAVPLDANPATAHMFIIKPFSARRLRSASSARTRRPSSALPRCWKPAAKASAHQRNPTCSGCGASASAPELADAPSDALLREAVPLLQHAHHPLRLPFDTRLGAVLLRVQPLEPRPHRGKFALDEAHEVGAGAVLQVHHVAADEPRAVVRDRLDRAFELRARRGEAGDDRRHQDAGVDARVDQFAHRAQPLQRVAPCPARACARRPRPPSARSCRPCSDAARARSASTSLSRTTIGPLVTSPTGVRPRVSASNRAPCQLVVAFDRLIRIGGRAERHLVALPRRTIEFALKHLHEVALHEDDRRELVTRVQLELRVIPAGEAVVAGVRAAAVRIQRPVRTACPARGSAPSGSPPPGSSPRLPGAPLP